MTAGFQSQPPFRKRLGRHRTRFSLFSADRVSAFQQLADPQRTQNSRNQGPVAKVGLKTGLTGVTTSVAAEAAVHQSIDDHGVMKMRPVGPLPIEPGKPVTFAAGGRRASPHARSVATEAVLGTLVVLTAGFLASHAPGTHEQPVWPFAWRLSVSAFY